MIWSNEFGLQIFKQAQNGMNHPCFLLLLSSAWPFIIYEQPFRETREQLFMIYGSLKFARLPWNFENNAQQRSKPSCYVYNISWAMSSAILLFFGGTYFLHYPSKKYFCLILPRSLNNYLLRLVCFLVKKFGDRYVRENVRNTSDKSQKYAILVRILRNRHVCAFVSRQLQDSAFFLAAVVRQLSVTSNLCAVLSLGQTTHRFDSRSPFTPPSPKLSSWGKTKSMLQDSVIRKGLRP